MSSHIFRNNGINITIEDKGGHITITDGKRQMLVINPGNVNIKKITKYDGNNWLIIDGKIIFHHTIDAVTDKFFIIGGQLYADHGSFSCFYIKNGVTLRCFKYGLICAEKYNNDYHKVTFEENSERGRATRFGELGTMFIHRWTGLPYKYIVEGNEVVYSDDNRERVATVHEMENGVIEHKTATRTVYTMDNNTLLFKVGNELVKEFDNCHIVCICEVIPTYALANVEAVGEALPVFTSYNVVNNKVTKLIYNNGHTDHYCDVG